MRNTMPSLFALTCVVFVYSATAAAQNTTVDVRVFGQNEFDEESVGWVTVDQQGHVVVSQARTNRMFLYDRDGRVLGQAGRRGAGPGETLLPLVAGWMGDTLWVADVQTLTISLFAPRLNFSASFRWPISLSGALPENVRRGNGGALNVPRALTTSRTILMTIPIAEENPGFRLSYSGSYVVVADLSGRILRVIGRAPRRTCPTDAVLPVQVILCGSPTPAFSPDGRLFGVLEDLEDNSGNEPRVQVTLTDDKGRRLFRQIVQGRAASIPASVADSVFGHLKERNPAAKQIADALRGAKYPLVRGIQVGSDSSVWLQMDSQHGVRWMVLDGRGNRISVVSPRPTDDIRVVGKDHAYAIRRNDDTGNEAVVLLRW